MEHQVYRRVLRMVLELHIRGYQRLRIAPGMSPSGCHWRCSITPATNISSRHGARMLSWDTLAAHYNSGQKRNYFGWDDASNASPSSLAELFIERFQEIAAAGRGSDWRYAGWYSEMLHLTYPDCFPIAYADWELPTDCLATNGESDSVRIPLPPPGFGIDGCTLEPSNKSALKSSVNIFTRYKQTENDFTNGLIAILSLSQRDGSQLVMSFLRGQLRLEPCCEINMFRVLQGMDGTADAELSGDDCCIHFESKIVSGTLDHEQIERHLHKLRSRTESLRRLVLLTPDDTNSRYIDKFLTRDADLVIHIGWRRVFDFLSNSVESCDPCFFSDVVRQFLERIRTMVFEQDFAGIIAKIQFGELSEVYEDKYLNEMNAGDWTQWNTPREYKKLDGTGRKLLLYDKTRNGITVEFEIDKVKRTDAEAGYPWTNIFAPGTLRFFEPPVSLNHIRSVSGLNSFGKGQSPYQNITHEQYRLLTVAQATNGDLPA